METMPIEAKVANVKSDIIKFVEVTGRDYGMPAFLMTGIISQVLTEWQKRELVEANDSFNKILETINEVASKEEK